MQEEIFPLVDEEGNVIGQAARSECHNGSKKLHPVIHLHVFNPEGKLFLQKRSPGKDIQPDKWDSSVGGHIGLHETPLEAARREGKEEIGLQNAKIKYITRYIIETEIERELTYCFYTIYNGSINIDHKEVTDGRFWTIEEIGSNIGKDLFTYNFEQDFSNFLYNGLEGLIENFR